LIIGGNPACFPPGVRDAGGPANTPPGGPALNDTARTRHRPELRRLRDPTSSRTLLWSSGLRVCEAVRGDLRIVRRAAPGGVILEIFSRDQQLMGLWLPDDGRAQLLGFDDRTMMYEGDAKDWGGPGAPAWRSIAPPGGLVPRGANGRSYLIDGEVVCCDEKGLAVFHVLRRRRNGSATAARWGWRGLSRRGLVLVIDRDVRQIG
jgi:hypothetical protein